MEIKSTDQVQAMREGGKMLATVLSYLSQQIKGGMPTKQLAELAGAKLKELGGEPAFLGYQEFPDVICISVNEEVVHGIPGNRQLKTGDVVGLDFGVKHKGLITDGAITVVVGGHSTSDIEKLIKATAESLSAGISRVKAGASVGDISHAIESRLRQDNLGVIETLVGHGVGQHIHEPPEVPNFGSKGEGMKLKAGMTIAIEPMATLGGKEVFVDEDGWTVKTSDGSLSAHFEHTVLVTDDGGEVLTQL